MPGSLAHRRNQSFGAGSTLFYREPVHIVRGEGIYLYDPGGRRYVDMYNNVPCVGHCHPHVVEAITRQVATLNVHSRYLHEEVVAYAERLTGHLHEGIESAVLSCTGTEANEVALMMARLATGGRGIICTNAAYHGNSTEVRKLTRCTSQEGEVRSIEYPQTYRYPGQGDPLDYYLHQVSEVIESFHRDGIPVAGMLVCSILANEGLPDIPPGFMPRAAELVREAGGLFISDEVQAGLARAGTWWGYEVTGFEPDIVTLGKPIGSGVPLAATAARRALVETFRRETRYFNTFASSPVQAAAGNAVLDVIEGEDLPARVRDTGEWLRGELDALRQGCEAMGEVRGHGLFIGIDWVSDRQSRRPDPDGAAQMVERLKDKGYLINNAGQHGNVLKLRPPLVFDRSDGEGFLGAFSEVLAERRA